MSHGYEARTERIQGEQRAAVPVAQVRDLIHLPLADLFQEGKHLVGILQVFRGRYQDVVIHRWVVKSAARALPKITATPNHQ